MGAGRREAEQMELSKADEARLTEKRICCTCIAEEACFYQRAHSYNGCSQWDAADTNNNNGGKNADS